MFHNRGSSNRTISLNYSDGSIAAICQQGLNTITHTTVLKALEQRATRYRVRGRLVEASTRMHNWGLDETGTIDTAGLLRSREKIQQQEEIDIRGVSEEVLQVHGVLQG
jgi:autotransporter translocation and assembly factor TamB